MRVFEVVEHHAADVKRVVTLGDSADLLEQLRLPGGIETASADEAAAARAGDLVVVDVPADDDGVAGLADVLAGVPDGATLLLLLGAPLAELPVGPVVTALTQAGLQVVEASPVAHTAVTAAVVARRPDGAMLPFVPYLGSSVLVGPDQQVRRVVNEHLLEGLVSRARDVDRDRLREELRSTQADLVSAREALGDVGRQLERERARLRAVEGSRTMAVGRAVAEVRRHPFRGLGRLPAALRRPE
jgi:hypothetical protein